MNSPYHDYRLYRDEGYASYSSTDRSPECVPTGFGRLHNHFQFQSPADIHGDALKQKLDQTRSLGTPRPQSLLRSSTNELLAGSPFAEGQFPPVLRVPVQLPIRPQDVLGSPARLSDTSTHSAISPRNTPFFHVDKSPNDSSDIGLSSRTVMKGDSSDDATSTHLSYDFTVDMEMEDDQSLKRPHADDSYALGGQKRKATSPNDEHLLLMPSDTSRRRDLSSRGCPQGRFTSLPRVATMPPVHTSRSNSYISTMSMSVHPAGLATANSFGRQLNPIPRTSTSGCKLILPQTISDASTRTVTEVKKPGGTGMQSFYMCECCPKKPKRFEAIEDLDAHEAEKQYKCSFCGNRFKAKNEAERHENSLHVRRHSWSCSALSEYDKAFQESTNRPGEADICGYCGDEFPRSGCVPGTGTLSGGNAPRQATDQDWDERIRHLEEIHKFRECNSSKKFFRADHFRQHLKHSHASTSGKWTTMLENDCMLDEDTTPR
ncbi:hypothetical protein FOMA001_g12887 [Fusarium oxysporum f. sp. matthiolae]|nr:hypothetical protein FOMA001_g12887 [Fusarium oxysporum f. sp. matthiolae]